MVDLLRGCLRLPFSLFATSEHVTFQIAPLFLSSHISRSHFASMSLQLVIDVGYCVPNLYTRDSL